MGGRAGIPCQYCGSSDAGICYSDGYYCFSCHKKVKEGSLFVTKEKKQEFDGQLPADFTRTIPPSATSYLAQYQMHGTKVLGWSESLQRIIFPIYQDEGLVTYWGRSLDSNKKNKWMNYGLKADVFLISDSPKRTVETLVLVEDLVSGYRVSKYFDVHVLCGTSLSKHVRDALPHYYDRLVIWLDPDDAGQTAAVKIYNKLALYMDVKNVKSLHDPKEHTDEEILAYVGE